jgi:hypothetical protein
MTYHLIDKARLCHPEQRLARKTSAATGLRERDAPVDLRVSRSGQITEIRAPVTVPARAAVREDLRVKARPAAYARPRIRAHPREEDSGQPFVHVRLCRPATTTRCCVFGPRSGFCRRNPGCIPGMWQSRTGRALEWRLLRDIEPSRFSSTGAVPEREYP